MGTRRRLAGVVAVMMGLAACGGGGGAGGPSPVGNGVGLVVENNSFSDVNVYVVSDGGDPQRVGLVPGTQTERFSLRTSYFPTGRLRLIAQPIGGGRTGRSETLSVFPGQTVTFTVQPDLATSYASVN